MELGENMKHDRSLWGRIWYMLLTNASISGFFQGKIHQGQTKVVCVPGLNCYSCPGAVGACPIGSLQSVLSGSGTHFSFYVTGFLLLFAAILGRVVCGFLCPFGLVQDLCYKIKSKKWEIPNAIDRPLRYLKYVILLGFVILFPLLLVDQFGIGAPGFCKWICPSGTLFAGLPLLATNESLRDSIGLLFYVKLGILLFILLLSVFTFRPFCKYLCPLGAFYGLFNVLSVFRLSLDQDHCTHCKHCETVCPMGVAVTENINSPECIRCGRCKKSCPHQCISAQPKTPQKSCKLSKS